MKRRGRSSLQYAILLLVLLPVTGHGQEDPVSVHGVRQVSVDVTPLRFPLGGVEAARQLQHQTLQAVTQQLSLYPLRLVTDEHVPRLVITIDPLCDNADMPTCAYYVEVALRERVTVGRTKQTIFSTTWRSTFTGMFRGHLPSARQAFISDVVTRVDQFAQAAVGRAAP